VNIRFVVEEHDMQQQQLAEVECQLERTVVVEEEVDLSDLGSFVVVEIVSTAVVASTAAAVAVVEVSVVALDVAASFRHHHHHHLVV
jgi:hypothetical protein